MRIAFIIQSLDSGGAERQLLLLASGLRRRGHSVVVVSLLGGGRLERSYREAGIDVRVLARSSRFLALAWVRFPAILWSLRPQVIHGYLPLANCVAVAVRLLAPWARSVLGIRAVTPERLGRLRRLETAYRIEALCSRLASAAIANSESARLEAIRRGFPPGRLHVVPNGIDIDRFSFDSRARADLRASWALPPDATVVGRVGGLRAIKDYPTFLTAAAAVALKRPDVRFVCAGDGPPGALDELQDIAADLGIGDRLRWIGHQEDMPAVMNALDVLVSSSIAESSPNVVAEAMACGVPCVVTDVGDSSALVGETGATVPVRAPKDMADAIVATLERMEREGDMLRNAARRRIVEGFDVEKMVSRAEGILGEVVVKGQRRRGMVSAARARIRAGSSDARAR